MLLLLLLACTALLPKLARAAALILWAAVILASQGIAFV
jgi:hypothetical protein